MSGYIPTSEAEQILWLLNSATWLTANGAAHGFSPAEITAYSTVVGNTATSLTNNVTAQIAAKAATAAKNTAFATAIAMARDNAQRLQNDPNMTDEDRAAAGLTIADESRRCPGPASAPGSGAEDRDLGRVATEVLLGEAAYRAVVLQVGDGLVDVLQDR